MSKFKINEKHQPETIEYMKSVIKKLTKEYKKIPEEWTGSLNLLADSYNIFIVSSNVINKEGITYTDKHGSFKSHPALKTKNDALIQCQKLNIEFSLTLKSSVKLQTPNDGEDTEIMNLINSKNRIQKR